jgi:hypothetical protein
MTDATQAARWGLADQELEACCEWFQEEELLKFALAIHENGYNKGYEECSFDMGDENV